jgi:hypothetical protein
MRQRPRVVLIRVNESKFDKFIHMNSHMLSMVGRVFPGLKHYLLMVFLENNFHWFY